MNRTAAQTLLLLVALVSAACASEIKDQGEAYEEVYVAIAYKRSECGNMPSFPIIMPKEPPVYGTDACSMAIIAQPCPFNQYPAECVLIYGAKVPGYGPATSALERLQKGLDVKN